MNGNGQFNYTLSEFEELRGYTEAYNEFLESYVSIVVGKTEFRRKSKHMLLSSFVTISDEAFALLTIKNNEHVWPIKYINSVKKDGDILEEEPKTKYTNRRRVSGSSRDGWTCEGMQQFLTYYRLVEANRKTDIGKEFEKNYLENSNNDDEHRVSLLTDSEGMERNRISEICIIPTDWEDDNIANVEKALAQMNSGESDDESDCEGSTSQFI